MQIIGYCLCGMNVYEDTDEDKLVFTCEEYPCELQEGPNHACDYWPAAYEVYDESDWRLGGER